MTFGERVFDDSHTRADQVRSRRARQGNRHELNSTARSAKRSKRKKPRRRYDLVLPIGSGAEARLPSLPAIRLNTRLLSVVFLVAILWALRVISSSADFQVSQAEVLGNTLLSPSQVRSIADVDQALVFGINPAAVIDRLTVHPEIASAEIEVRWPNEIIISVVERVPVLFWSDGGKDWWISEEGVAFKARGSEQPTLKVRSEQSVLDIQNEAALPVLPATAVQAALDLSAQFNGIENLSYDPVHGFGFQDPNGWQATFGSEGDMSLKAKMYQKMVEYIQSQAIEIELVSVEQVEAPYFR
jgi:cell division septal protein FtsQ